jgi:hypothetical protein
VSIDEIIGNDYSLNIPRYVDTFEPEEPRVEVQVFKYTPDRLRSANAHKLLVQWRGLRDGHNRIIGISRCHSRWRTAYLQTPGGYSEGNRLGCLARLSK